MILSGNVVAMGMENTNENNLIVVEETAEQTVETVEQTAAAENAETVSVEDIQDDLAEDQSDMIAAAGGDHENNSNDKKGYFNKDEVEIYRQIGSDKPETVKVFSDKEVIIEEEITDADGDVWYTIKFDTWHASHNDYVYVRAEDITLSSESEEIPPVEEDQSETEEERQETEEETPATDEHACDCQYPPESGNLAAHVDGCARKTYVKSLFEGKTAEEIYAVWETYDEALQTDLLNMLQSYDGTKYEALKQLLDGTHTTDKEISVGSTSIQANGVPENVELKAQEVSSKAYHENLFDMIGSKKVVFAFDIQLTNEDGSEWQPGNGKTVIVTLDAASLGLVDGERIGILHDHNTTLQNLGVATVANGKITFETDGFSVFYGYTVDFEYDGTWHFIGGGSDIYLYELFAQLGIDRFTSEVVSVSFSNPSLIAVTQQEVDGYTGRRDWHLQSLQPFNTEEILTIGFNDGTELFINVYDATYTSLSNNLTLNNGDIIEGAMISGSVTITLNGTVMISNTITIPRGASLTINGSGTLKRDSDFLLKMFNVQEGGSLSINGNSNIIIDGGASWTSTEVNNSTRETLAVTVGGDVTSTAIYSKGGDITLINVTMKNLYTKSEAPAIHTMHTDSDGDKKPDEAKAAIVTLTNVTVQDCATTSGQSILLFNHATATMTNCVIQNNYSGGTYAGAIKAGGPNYYGNLTMMKCTATGNYSSGWGGVILWAANSDFGGSKSKATIDGCTFTENKARYLGGAISNEAIMEVKNSIINNNIAMAGGGIATFPFTLTETQTSGGNACGLTLGSGNVIEGNTAYANNSFTPFSSTEEGANGDDTTISNQITYPAGGGGIWCYMNKLAWTCSFEVGDGNKIKDNTSNCMGGGVYVHQDAGQATKLSITGATIYGNSAPNGGGVALQNATLDIYSGTISNNTATQFGGGAYVNNGTCIISDPTDNPDDHARIEGNTAANGGGLYIDGGSDLTVTGGIITKNSAVGNPNVDSAHRDAASCGVGGGIYVSNGTSSGDNSGFTMSGDYVGLYGNTADFAAADAYASGEYTTLNLPNVSGMELEGVAAYRATGWFADYNEKDNDSYPTDILKENGQNTTNPGRYVEAEDDNVEATPEILTANPTTYYCLTIGTAYPGYGDLIITKSLDEGAAEDQTFLFGVTGTTKFNETYSATVTLVIKEGQTSAKVTIKNIPDGTYTVTEDGAWSWRYTLKEGQPISSPAFKDGKVHINIAEPIWEVSFANTRTENKWLSGDSYCENWFRGDVKQRDENNNVISNTNN